MLRNCIKRLLQERYKNKDKRTYYKLPERIQAQDFNESKGHVKHLSIFAATLGYFTYNIYDKYNVAHASSILEDKSIRSNSTYPIYTRNEVSQHATFQDRIWITYEDGVYDITDFIQHHPGADQILMAAGSAVDPFWMLYSFHKSPDILNILKKYRIGTLDPREDNDTTSDMSDPYSHDPKRHPVLKTISGKPFNGEPPEGLLVESFFTPNELFYVRNHLPVPEIDPETYSLEIEIEGKRGITSLSLDDIKKFPKRSVTATLMCAGNRRSEMSKVKPVQGLNWGVTAVGNATWSGASLREILYAAGLDEHDIDKLKHVQVNTLDYNKSLPTSSFQFEGFDTNVDGTGYGASIPIWRATDSRGDVILAYEMNGVTLPRDHGFPLRVIVPGVVGARNVKWLGKIIVSSEESKSHWQQKDYKGVSPSSNWDNVDLTKCPSIQELPVISAICQPSDNSTATIKDGHITVKGYAWSGGGSKIVRVDVTSDGGKTWHVAAFDQFDSNESPRHWSWTLWSCDVPVPKDTKKVQIWAKAVDSNYNTQPERFENIYNFRGVLNNAYHRININLA